MNDEEICLALDQAFQDLELGLYFQVSQNPPYLYIFINRPVGSVPDYDRITALVGETIVVLDLVNLTYLALYSRPFGEVEPDWEVCMPLSDFEKETIVVNLTEKDRSIPDLNSLPDDDITEITEYLAHRASQPFSDSDQELNSDADQGNQSIYQTSRVPETDLDRDDFSQYCFVDDRNDLTPSNLELSLKIAKALVVFHRFPTRGKHRVLPLLGQIFEGDRGIVFIHFPQRVQQWFEYVLTFTETEIENAKLWFSCYCQNTSVTLQEMQALLKAEHSASSPPAPSPPAPETVPSSPPQPPLLIIDDYADTPIWSEKSAPLERSSPNFQPLWIRVMAWWDGIFRH